MKKKMMVLAIIYCNSTCPFFYHKYEDSENCWCDELDKKLRDYNGEDPICDTSPTEIPDECPLEDYRSTGTYDLTKESKRRQRKKEVDKCIDDTLSIPMKPDKML